MSSKRILECPYCETTRLYRSFQEFESHMRSCCGKPRQRFLSMRQSRLFATGAEG